MMRNLLNPRTLALMVVSLLLVGAGLPSVALAQDDEDAEDPEENETAEIEDSEGDEEADEEDENDADEEDENDADEEDENDADEEAEDEADDGEAEDEADDGEAEDEADDGEADDDADDGDEADQDDESEDRDDEERSVTVESDEDGMTLELERESGSSEDKVEMSFAHDEATFELTYEAEEGENETEQKLEAVFQALAEYRDENGNGQYDVGEPLASAWALGEEAAEADVPTNGSATWAHPTVTDITVDDTPGKQITATATLADNGTFELRFLVFGDFVDLESGTLAPTSAKIDIVIEHYPYQADDTALALFMETKAETELETDADKDDDEDGVATTSSLADRNVELAFTWKDFADVDGNRSDVATTELAFEQETERDEDGFEDETKRSFVLSYPRGDRIVHDPEARVTVQSTDEGLAPTPGWTALTALATLGLAALALRRGR